MILRIASNFFVFISIIVYIDIYIDIPLWISTVHINIEEIVSRMLEKIQDSVYDVVIVITSLFNIRMPYKNKTEPDASHYDCIS